MTGEIDKSLAESDELELRLASWLEIEQDDLDMRREHALLSVSGVDDLDMRREHALLSVRDLRTRAAED